MSLNTNVTVPATGVAAGLTFWLISTASPIVRDGATPRPTTESVRPGECSLESWQLQAMTDRHRPPCARRARQAADRLRLAAQRKAHAGVRSDRSRQGMHAQSRPPCRLLRQAP